MPVWKFAPTARGISADTRQFASDIAFDFVDTLPIVTNTSTTVSYQGSLIISGLPTATNFTLTGSGLSTLGEEVTGGTITRISLTYAGSSFVNVTGLNLSGARFGELADWRGTGNIELLEILLLSGNDNITGTNLGDDINGMAGKDKITTGNGGDAVDGGSGNDVIYDGKGNDDYAGGSGADRFVFKTNVYAAGFNSIDDFTGKDVIVLDNDAFKGIGGAGKLAASKIHNLDNGGLPDANDRLYYSQTSGSLYYDPDGRGQKNPVLILSFENGTRITAADFLIIN